LGEFPGRQRGCRRWICVSDLTNFLAGAKATALNNTRGVCRIGLKALSAAEDEVNRLFKTNKQPHLPPKISQRWPLWLWCDFKKI